ncbi:MAG: DUF4956 domain-containing protein [Lachnospiraceae bacterium]|nr:DUF4956 domain-containing protein [Lachnospiraceae bacterium]
MNSFFTGIFESTTTSLQIGDFLLCLCVSLAIGAFLAFVYTVRNQYTQSFILTIGLIPAVVCVVIMMVNGNIGAGIAVAGAFSLVRFRSAPGSAKEICAIFLAMGVGLMTGMGYLGYATVFAIVLGAAMLLFNVLFGKERKDVLGKTLHITIPENLEFETVFDDLLDAYTSKHQLMSVKTTNMGSLYKLTYDVVFKETGKEKEFMDQIRCRNGNLEVSLTRSAETAGCEL